MTVLSPRQYVAGASAGVYGLLFSHLATIILNWNEMDRKCCRLFWLLVYIVLNFSTEIIVVDLHVRTKYDCHYRIVQIFALYSLQDSFVGHFGGAITGFLVSILVLKNFEKHPWEKQMQTVCLVIVMALLAVIILINITASGVYLPTEWNFNYTSSYENLIVNMVVASGKDSTAWKQCQQDSKCMVLLSRKNVTVT